MAGAVYVVEDYVASGSFSRVFRVHEAKRWGEGRVYAAKVMRKAGGGGASHADFAGGSGITDVRMSAAEA